MDLVRELVKMAAWVTVIPWTYIAVMYTGEIITTLFGRSVPYTFLGKGKIQVSLWKHFVIFAVEGLLIGIILYV
jgi:hypothetical protein